MRSNCSPFVKWSLSLAVTCTLLLSNTLSFAYCRTRTCEFTSLSTDGDPIGANEDSCERDPITQCPISGQDIFWDSRCLALSIHEDGSIAEGIGAQTLDTVMQQAIAHWQDLSCDNQTVFRGFVRGITPCDQLQYNCEADSNGTNPGYGSNENIVVFRDGESLLEFREIALTTITANLSTGEILDADIELNSRDHIFHVGNTTDASSNELLGVLTHELGHFLGLSHSLVPDSLMGMYGQAEVAPAADDVAGYCEIWGGQAALDCEQPAPPPSSCAGSITDCPVAPTRLTSDAGCACSVPGSTHSPTTSDGQSNPIRQRTSSTWLLCALALMLRSRRFLEKSTEASEATSSSV